MYLLEQVEKLFVLKLPSSKPNYGRCIYIVPFQEVVNLQVAQWRQKFGKIQGGKNIVALTADLPVKQVQTFVHLKVAM